MNNSFSINPYLLNYVPKDYAGNLPQGSVRLDCSLGVNAAPIPDGVFSRLKQFRQGTAQDEGDFKDIKYYPHDERLKDTLANWYRSRGVGADWLTADYFLLGNGSYDILCNLNLLCLTQGQAVLGHAPQFTAYIDHVNCSGYRYEAYYLERESNYTFFTESYLAKMSGDYELFIVENPNNPTGQTIPLKEIQQIAEKAATLGKILIVDEAYGEYMPFFNSAINLVKDMPNVIVTRTFSKGWGMAGLRLGYAVAQAGGPLLRQLQKLVLPFNSNALARTLALVALDAGRTSDPFCLTDISSNKWVLLSEVSRLGQKNNRPLKVAKTEKSTPIMTLYYEQGGEGFDLQHHFMKVGLLTVSCGTYLGLGTQCARLMLPRSEQMPLLLELLEQSIQDLPI